MRLRVVDMSTKDQILETLRKKRVELELRYPIRRMALFGSWARGEASEDSDVDVLIEVDGSIGLRFIELADELERALGRLKVAETVRRRHGGRRPQQPTQDIGG